MNKVFIRSMFTRANSEDYLKIDYGTKCLEIPKRFLKYKFLQDGHLELINTGKKETYLIKTSSIDLITVIEPKIRGMSWYDGRTQTKIGA